MSWYAVVLLVALAALGAGDVGAVARSDRDLSRILRPAFGVLLLALAWLGRAEPEASRAVTVACKSIRLSLSRSSWASRRLA